MANDLTVVVLTGTATARVTVETTPVADVLTLLAETLPEPTEEAATALRDTLAIAAAAAAAQTDPTDATWEFTTPPSGVVEPPN